MTTTTAPKQPVPGWKVVLFLIVVLGGGYLAYTHDVVGTVRNKVSELTTPVAPLPAQPVAKAVIPSILTPPAQVPAKK
jgi:hypothetical protein